MVKLKEQRCESCQQMKPAGKFLPSSLSPTGYITKCTDCIKATGARHRAAQKRSKSGGALVPAPPPPPAVRPFSQRISPHLLAAAKRFILNYRDGTSTPTAGEIEPELRRLLEWLADQVLQEQKARTPEQVGREIIEYKDANICRGMAYGALGAALVRVEALYERDDALIIEGSTPRAAWRKAALD